MNDKLDYENLKLNKFSTNYNSEYSTSYNPVDPIKAENLLEKLSVFEKNIKTSIPSKKIHNINSIENSIENIKSNFNNRSEKNNLIGKETINNNIKLMDIKLNHQILQNKIENITKNLKGDNSNNTKINKFNTISTNNYLDINDNNYSVMNYNNNNNEDYNEHNDDYSSSRNYYTGSNFYKRDSKNNFYDNNINNNSNYFPNQNSERKYNYNYDKNFKTINFNKNNNYLEKENKSNNLSINNEYSKTMGNFEYERSSVLSKYKITNNGLKLDYTKKDLAELEGKIELTKQRLNKCLNRAENLIQDKKITQKILERSKNDNRLYQDKIQSFKEYPIKTSKNLLGIFITKLINCC